MAQILKDTFTEATNNTPLSSHTADSGATWSLFAGASTSPGVYTSFNGVVATNATTATVWRSSVLSGTTADTDSVATVRMDAVAAPFNVWGLCVRLNAGGTAGYLAAYSRTAGTWSFYQITGAGLATTTIATSAAVSYTAGNTTSVEFKAVGSGASVQLDLLVAGTNILSFADTSAGRITAIGYPGIWFDSSTAATGWFVDVLTVTDLVGGTTVNPGVGALTLAGPIPTLAQTSGNNVSPGTAALALTGYAPPPMDNYPPPPVKVADRVRENATGIANNAITISGATAGMQSFSSAFALGATNVPVCLADSAGAWMVCRTTLTNATTLTLTSIDSSSAAGAQPSFGAGLVAYCVMPAKLAFKARHLDLADYAVYPDFSTDSTPGINAAIADAMSRRIEKIIAPPGRFRIAGALSGSGNAQIPIPVTNSSSPNRSIWIEGASPPNFEAQGLIAVPASNDGTTFESTITGSGSRPSVIGHNQPDGTDPSGYAWNYTNLILTNLGIRVKADGAAANSMRAVGAYYAAQVPRLDLLMLGPNVPLFNMTNPTGGGSIGIELPPVNNHAFVNLGTLYISGFETGVLFGEHTSVERLMLLGCVNGISLPDVFHSSSIRHLSCEFVKNSIVINGNHPLAILLYETEHDTSIAWCAHAADILKNSGTRKIAIVRSSVVVSGTGYDETAFHANDATIYKILVGAGAN